MKLLLLYRYDVKNKWCGKLGVQLVYLINLLNLFL